ncbi:MAG: DUF4382 domain-containing protein [Halodesulfurarchaeum sp.]
MSAKASASVFLALLLVLAGCAGGISGSPPTKQPQTPGSGTPAGTATGGVVELYISDRPTVIDQFASLNVTVSQVGFERESGGWTKFPVDNRTVDLTRLVGSNASLVGAFDVPEGNYTTVFVYVEDVNATLKTGESVRVKLPSERLHITSSFTVTPNSSIDFVFDIAVHKAGRSGKFILRPVISESGTDVPIDAVKDGADSEKTKGDNTEGNTTKNKKGAEEGGAKENATDQQTPESGPGNESRAGENPAPNSSASSGSTLSVAFVGQVVSGKSTTIHVTRNGTPVAHAIVEVNGNVVGQTGEAGQVTFEVPVADSVKVKVITETEKVEVERDRPNPDESGKS